MSVSSECEILMDKYDLRNKKWTYKGLQAKLHYFFPVGEEPLKPLRDFFGDSYEVTVFFIVDNFCHWFWNDEDMTRLRKKFIENVTVNPTYLDTFLQEWEKRVSLFNEIMHRIDGTDLSTLSDDELLILYRRWYEAYINEYGLAIGIQDAFSMHSDRFLFPHFEKILQEKGISDVTGQYVVLTNPLCDSFLNREHLSLLKIAKQVVAGLDLKSEKIQLQLKEHAKSYHWIHNNYAVIRDHDVAYFEKQLKEILANGVDVAADIAELSLVVEKAREKKKALVEKLQLDEYSQLLIRIVELFAYMQDERKKYVLMASHYQRNFLVEIKNRLGITLEKVESTYFHELAELLVKRDSIDEHVLSERSECCVVIQTLNGHEVISGEVARELYDSFSQIEENVHELKGTVASSGAANGKVRILKKVADLALMQEGEIIVTTMTRPEMVVAMKKAAAIVTDEGGITSHAAVVSRELGIPCVIGTKSATKIFSDGDLVEVDAEKGIVRKVD